MINEQIIKQGREDGEKLVNSLPLGDLVQQLKKASPEEREKCAEIGKNIAQFLKSNDLKGGLKYLKHVRKQL